MDHIAELANVSKATVSRALRNSPLVNEATKSIVLEAARNSGYVVNKNARKLRDKRTNTIAIALDFPSFPGQRVADPFVFELFSDIVNSLAVREKDVILCSPNASDAFAYQQLLAAKSADGIIFLGQGDREDVLNELAGRRAPVVVWGGAVDDAPYCTVGSDDRHGGYLAGSRLADLGCTNVLYMGNHRHLESRLRREGLEAGLKDANGQATVSELIVKEFTYETCLPAAQRFLSGPENRPDGVFAVSDIAAIAFAAALREVGLAAGKDVPIVGYNDIPSAACFSPAITTVRQDTLQAGALLVEKLMQILEGLAPKSVMLPTNLVVRET